MKFPFTRSSKSATRITAKYAHSKTALLTVLTEHIHQLELHLFDPVDFKNQLSSAPDAAPNAEATETGPVNSINSVKPVVPEPSCKYSDKQLADVLIAAGNFYQYLKLTGNKISPSKLVLLEYLSPTSLKDGCFDKSCWRLYDRIKNPTSDEMLRVHLNSLLNLYSFLLIRLEQL